MRSFSANHNITAISATNRESAINTFQDVDLSILSDIGDIINISLRREDNRDEANGKEEPDLIYDNGGLAEGSRNHNRAQPQHFAYLLAYGLGVCATTAAGAGYLHTITPIQGGIDRQRELPSMNVLCRLGKTVLKRRFYSMFVDQVTATFAKDDWVKIAGTLKGTGKYDDNVTEETVTAAANATSLNLAANGVEGDDAAGRLDSIHRVKVELTAGVWTEVEVTAVSAATPAVLTITAPSATTDDVSYKILYVPTETAVWDLPEKVVESNLRVSEFTINLGGTWNGTTIVGGREIGSEVNQVVYSLANNSVVEFLPGAGGVFASNHERGDRVQTLKVDRKMRDFVLQQQIADNEYLCISMKAVGAEFDTGHNYQVQLVFPRVGILGAPISVNGKKLAEAGDWVILEDATYGSAIALVKNLWAGYAG